MTIEFYHQRGPYGGFSNFSPHPVEIDGVIWPTSEHYFQAMKFPYDPERQRRIRQASSPGQAKRIAWEEGAMARLDWYTLRAEVMLRALRAKFSQHRKIRRLLLGTGEERLVEHTARDRYWGDGGDGTGENMLGQLLMQVREELRSESQGEAQPTHKDQTRSDR